MILDVYSAALFSRAPLIGEINPEGEVSYLGYRRVPIVAGFGVNLEKIEFPPSEQDEPVYVTHVVALDGAGRVVGVRML